MSGLQHEGRGATGGAERGAHDRLRGLLSIEHAASARGDDVDASTGDPEAGVPGGLVELLGEGGEENVGLMSADAQVALTVAREFEHLVQLRRRNGPANRAQLEQHRRRCHRLDLARDAHEIAAADARGNDAHGQHDGVASQRPECLEDDLGRSLLVQLPALVPGNDARERAIEDERRLERGLVHTFGDRSKKRLQGRRR